MIARIGRPAIRLCGSTGLVDGDLRYIHEGERGIWRLGDLELG